MTRGTMIKYRILKQRRYYKMHFKLNTFSTGDCTIGKLYLQGELICKTIEKPWEHNKANISCIPAGVYNIEPVNSPKFGETYEVKDVIGRTHILFHKANKASQLKGCIAPVNEFGIMDNEWAGYSSGVAYDKLMALMGKGNHTLDIARY